MQIRAGTGTLHLWRPHWFVVAVFALLALLSLQYSFKARDDRSAILRWRPQILQLQTANIYERYAYPNPPIMALLLTPIALLPPIWCALAWFYLKVGMALAALWWSFRLVETPGQPLPAWGKAVVILLCLKAITGDLSHGNVNLFILFLVIGGLFALQKGYDLTAGLSLALAIACKVTPALFIPYLLWKRAWKTLAGCALGLVLFLLVAPGIFLGMQRNGELLTSWYKCMVQPFVAEGIVTTEHINQSLPGLIYRWGSHSPSAYDKEGRPLEYVNVVDLDQKLLAGMVKVCMALFAALVLWTCRTPFSTRGGWRLAAEYSLVMVGMLIFSERTWKHHCVTLMLPFTVIVYCWATCRPSIGLRNYLIGTAVAAELLMVSTMGGISPGWDRVAKMFEAGGAYVWGFLGLTAALVVLLRRPDHQPSAPFAVHKAA